jgi:hypothetical protein
MLSRKCRGRKRSTGKVVPPIKALVEQSDQIQNLFNRGIINHLHTIQLILYKNKLDTWKQINQEQIDLFVS